MNKWTEYLLYGGDIPMFDLPEVPVIPRAWFEPPDVNDEEGENL